MSDYPVCSRFAPSPTGPLHFGSVVAALGSYLYAKTNAGKWLLRIDDLDPPREVAGASESIIRQLAMMGLHSDQPTLYQSNGEQRYQAALSALRSDGLIYDCGCTRRDLPKSGIYPGTCRGGLNGKQARSIRFSCPELQITYDDLAQGPQSTRVSKEFGDFIVKRADGLIAYHLAMVVDDAFQGVSHVVRGLDLQSSTVPQILLQQALALPTPKYLHLPIAVNSLGDKLSKQSFAKPTEDLPVNQVMCDALSFLGLGEIADARQAMPQQLLAWALERWSPKCLPKKHAIEAPEIYCTVR